MTPPAAHPAHPALAGLTVLERGWLSSNNLLIHPGPQDSGATLVDTGHANHAAQTLALVQHALAGQPLGRIVNTHLHSDHCGGNATLAAALGAAVHIPPGQAAAVAAWDEVALSYQPTGQHCQRFAASGLLAPGHTLQAGGRAWQVLAAPGHDPYSVMLFDPEQRLLVSADALWEHGFGVVFPELSGEPGYADVAAVLDHIERLAPACVVPGHGAPFADVAAALGRARARLDGFVAQPARHARHAAKVLIKYHLMEVQQQPRPALLQWAAAAPLLVQAHSRFGPPGPAAAWAETLLDELLAQGVLRAQGALVLDA
jgi:glyoxylase-like metal-dependent hydrolase (beta-lactamase superfamily II)